MNFFKDEHGVSRASAWGVSAAPTGLGTVGVSATVGLRPRLSSDALAGLWMEYCFHCERKRPHTGQKCRQKDATIAAEGGIIYEIYKIPRAERAGVLEHRAAGETKKGNRDFDSIIKLGGDILFHNQVQYHRRCEA